jgi:hypothetical protein
MTIYFICTSRHTHGTIFIEQMLCINITTTKFALYTKKISTIWQML